MKPITILGIESSCDDTSAAILENRAVLSNVIANQEVHEKYGGVVPELASRAHQSNILPVVHQALEIAQKSLSDVDAICYTIGPGLSGSLMVGSSFAKGLSIGSGIPLIEAHHMKAHVLAHLIVDDAQRNPGFPFLCLTVSGGHTQIVQVDSPEEMHVIGKTRDDAAGEAFDKAAKILGLPYPGGPLVDKYAKEGDGNKFVFAKPDIPDLDFSFSGVKTSILYFIRDEVKSDPDFISKNRNDLCASIQATIVDILIVKLRRAIKLTGIKSVAIAGGVSANSGLRAAMLELQHEGCEVFLPKFAYCTDNAAMIAIYGHYQFLDKKFGALNAAPKARYAF
ncbi:MAG TPA: tRNA (adenosine(37)-N6)-threonylcarbamoyltransferase complex transferase subunit TsaD [Flavobacteriales bacterium]|mgnify:CR=1 FL=1|nr:tRNA (adenosine(37)-N6)-threonylcarbamoyltransferase complex transferase subunit TsaD [Flavobacteriales bacterium]MDB9701142.1 tRNA (adenosine(37)-N6)-threonylcarbamoyltransferase complex transferase subunit TsaD [Salibacteraceae bacterium]HAW19279.1 tRNA (adenosine(37)-N6)-threonylcarbamoyltransferase complex transferase subunit TsaD [Flavobacteriales bacterium]